MATYKPLSTDFKDDILASQNSKRKYTQVNNSDGTVSFQDSTAYSQVGSSYGAKEIIEEREAINNIYANKLVTLDEIDLVTEPGFFVDAQVVKELNSKIVSFAEWKQSFLGKRVYRLQFGNSNNGIIQTNQLSIPWRPEEVTVELFGLNIQGAGTVPIDYKVAHLSEQGGLYVYCSTPGASGVNLLPWQVVDATILIQRK